MVHKVLLWSGFGVLVRLWQMGLEMRHPFTRGGLWAYPFYAGIGGGVGYWLIGVEERQDKFLTDKRDALLAKRRRMAERIRESGGEIEPAMLAQGGAGVQGVVMPVEIGEEGRRPTVSQDEELMQRAEKGAREAGRAAILGNEDQEGKS